MTALYPYQHSRGDDFELKYSLRSLSMYSKVKDIVIIGDKPKIKLKNITHIPAQNVSDKTYYKERNIAIKTLAALQHLPEMFIFCNDDHFLTAPFTTLPYAGEWPRKENQYKHTIENTKQVVGAMPFFDLHCPMLMFRDHAMNAIATVDWNVKGGYCLKTLYAKQAGITSVLWYKDLKFEDDQLPYTDIMNQIKDRAWFSIADRCRTPQYKQVLDKLYPNKSPWEV